MSAPLRLGIVGCGFVTRDRHLPSIARVREVEVVALADSDPDTLAHVADRWGVERRYPDPRALIEDQRVEAVAVCTPAAGHAAIAHAALAAGRAVFVEKPLALALGEADALVEHAATVGGRVVVGFQLRWHRLARRARELIAHGTIGRVLAVRSQFGDPLLQRPGVPTWRRRRETGGGSLVDKAIHHFDLWRWLLDDEIEWVQAASLSAAADDEIAAVTARTARGALLTATSSDVTAIGNEMTLDGDAGTIHLDFYRFDGLGRRGTEELAGAPARRLRRAAGSLAALLSHLGEIRHGGSFAVAYDAQWRHVVDVVRRGVAPACGLADGRAALAIALAAQRSLATGERCAVASPASAADRRMEADDAR